ncbi:MAG: hypothetical protein H0W08_07760 [Acidobacteria bacterium]|nr:hypothetical protein [Acidobacteriota bacterium]
MEPGRKSRGRSRILYWFRTPPGIRVGRGPLDPEAIRLIESSNPDLDFDWTRILKGQPDEEPAERRAPPRKRRAAAPAARRAENTPTPPVVRDVLPVLPAIDEPTTAAHARLGSEGLARLRGRYSEMLARIGDRVPEPERQEELKALAERLNPDAWVTDTEVTGGLESYESTFASLRGAFGPRRQGPTAT